MEKYVGLAMILMGWAALIYLLLRWRGTRAMSISQHAASADGATKLFAGTLVIAGFIFYVWLMTWFSDALDLSLPFKLILTASFICQFVAAVVPDTTGWKRITHRAGAYTMAALYIPLAYFVLKTPALSVITKLIGTTAIAYMIFGWFLFFFVKKAWDYYLILQSIYIVIFQCTILSAAYIR